MQEYTGVANYSMYIVNLSIPVDGTRELDIWKICDFVNKKYYMNFDPTERYPYYVDKDAAIAIFINYLINRCIGLYYISHTLYTTIEITAYVLYNEKEKKSIAIAAHTIQEGQCSDYPEIMWYE